MKAQAEIDKEKRQEKYYIEGKVKKIEMREKEVESKDTNDIRTTEEKTEKGIKVNVQVLKKQVKYCVVVFEDGREKVFESVPSAPLDSGTYYKIEYNGMNEIVSVSKQ